MKKLIASLIVTLSLSNVSHAQENLSNHEWDGSSKFVVHEWGTFTTLAGSDGVLLPGLYHEEETLPGFVLHFPGFAGNGRIRKGLYLECANVTIKMETPVIYFYSDVARTANVRVDWPGGTISQWYPERADGEILPQDFYGSLDFATAHNGWIEWNANIHARTPSDTTGMYKPYETHTWQAPRATDANVITDTSGAVEKYLFYRGVGNASFMDGAANGQYILRTFFEGNTLVIDNLTHYDIAYAFVFERTQDGTNHVWWSGQIKDAETLRCTAPKQEKSNTFDATLTQLRDKLVEAGLFQKEADAMINTWRQSYFGTSGLRVFWIVPRQSTDRSLQLNVTPNPDALERVLVARSEVLTPDFEKQLASDFASGNGYKYSSDRYYLAYQARVQAMITAGVVTDKLPVTGISIYPNPITGTMTITLHENGRAQIRIINLLGNEVARIFSAERSANDGSITLDTHNLPQGTYVCVVQINGRVEHLPMVVVR